MSRIDKYLWHTRFFKSRTLAAEAVASGRIRLNAGHCTKPAQAIKAGDVLTIAIGNQVRVIKVVSYGERRGPASEARTLYEDLTPPPPPREEAANETSPNPMRRPDRRERRAITQLKAKHFDA